MRFSDRSSKLDEDHGPKLWCGMGNNKVLVFDASTWLLETQYIQAKERIVSDIRGGGFTVVYWRHSIYRPRRKL